MNSHVILYLKGLAMGAADIVPGVSGGTIAFITGIYEQLLESIRRVNPSAAKLLFQQGIKAFWQHINGTFLVTLIAGIATSFLLLSHAITYVMQNMPLVFWSFVFGLILASCVHVGKMIKEKTWLVFFAFLLGFAISLTITLVKPAQVEPSYWMIFLAGAIAICAMILPGISGSFMLLLLGLYGFMIQAIKSLDLPIILLFVLGCVTGLLLFAHVVSWLFRKWHYPTLAFLTGMLVASLNAVWPWRVAKYVVVTGDSSKVLTESNVLPTQYEQLLAADAMVATCVAIMFIGFALVLLLEQFSNEK